MYCWEKMSRKPSPSEALDRAGSDNRSSFAIFYLQRVFRPTLEAFSSLYSFCILWTRAGVRQTRFRLVHELREPQVSGDVAQSIRRSLLLVERGAAGRAYRGGGMQGAHYASRLANSTSCRGVSLVGVWRELFDQCLHVFMMAQAGRARSSMSEFQKYVHQSPGFTHLAKRCTS